MMGRYHLLYWYQISSVQVFIVKLQITFCDFFISIYFAVTEPTFPSLVVV